MNNLVSIITPLYNSEKYIEETIESVINQTYEDWEMIIVDDCSNDNGTDIVEKICEIDERIKLIRLKKNSGPATARNTGIMHAEGRYITFIDSDDIWDAKFLEKQLKFIKSKDAEIVFSSYERRDEKLNKSLGAFIVPERVSYRDILKSNSMACLTTIYDAYKLGKKYMPNVMKQQDQALWLRILKDVKYAYGNKEILAVYRIRSGSVSRNKLKLVKHEWTIFREVENLSIIKSMYYLFWWGVYGVIKNRKILFEK